MRREMSMSDTERLQIADPTSYTISDGMCSGERKWPGDAFELLHYQLWDASTNLRPSYPTCCREICTLPCEYKNLHRVMSKWCIPARLNVYIVFYRAPLNNPPGYPDGANIQHGYPDDTGGKPQNTRFGGGYSSATSPGYGENLVPLPVAALMRLTWFWAWKLFSNLLMLPRSLWRWRDNCVNDQDLNPKFTRQSKQHDSFCHACVQTIVVGGIVLFFCSSMMQPRLFTSRSFSYYNSDRWHLIGGAAPGYPQYPPQQGYSQPGYAQPGYPPPGYGGYQQPVYQSRPGRSGMGGMGGMGMPLALGAGGGLLGGLLIGEAIGDDHGQQSAPSSQILYSIHVSGIPP